MRLRLLLLLMSLLLGACNLQRVMPSTTTPLPTATAISPTDTTNAGWSSLAPGLQQRILTPEGTLAAFQTIRLDPAQYTFRAHYAPQNPRTLAQWRDALPDAALIVNANFFSPQATVQGLLISDGQVYGSSYTDRGGTFLVDENGNVDIRSNLRQPYRGEAWQQAVQAFPMLVLDGEQAFTNPRQTTPARRTLIGQDANGHIVIMATPTLGIGLTPLSAYLAQQNDLNLVDAFNLDGGGSVMLYIAANDYALPAFDPVPAVLAAYPRG